MKTICRKGSKSLIQCWNKHKLVWRNTFQCPYHLQLTHSMHQIFCPSVASEWKYIIYIYCSCKYPHHYHCETKKNLTSLLWWNENCINQYLIKNDTGKLSVRSVYWNHGNCERCYLNLDGFIATVLPCCACSTVAELLMTTVWTLMLRELRKIAFVSWDGGWGVMYALVRAFVGADPAITHWACWLVMWNVYIHHAFLIHLVGVSLHQLADLSE